jgi:hypothetical protein
MRHEMIVPIHALRAAAGRGAQARVKPAVIGAVAAAVAVGMVSDLLHARAIGGGSAKTAALGLAIGIGAALVGFALARAIGRQGKL